MQGNPSAFPQVCLNDPGHPASIPGMTLLDYFAGQALTRFDAKHAYEIASTMMAEREKWIKK